MNNLVIPPSANWYETLILACAPDNTLMYGSRNDIVIVYDSPDDQPSDVKIILRAHSQKIISTHINRGWGQPNKLLVTAAEDNIIKLWDVETRKKKLGHNAHIGHGKVIGAVFAGDDKIISVSEEGTIIIWNVTQNRTNVLKDVLGMKVTVTCISTCPHANWLTAFGLRNGLVVVTDLRKHGKVLYKLRGHDKSVLSLSWCPAPVNIFPNNPHNYVGTKNAASEESSETKDTCISGEQSTQLPIGSKQSGFLKDCQSLMEAILGQVDSESVPEVILEAKPEQESSVQAEEKDLGGNAEVPSSSVLEAPKKSSEEDISELKKDCEAASLTKSDAEAPLDESIEKPTVDVKESSEAELNKGNVETEEGNIKSPITCGEAKREIPKNVPVMEEPRREFLLASSGKDGNIYIWRAGTDGRMQTFLNVPNKAGHRRSAKSRSDKLWIALCWVSPTVLLSSSKSAELVKWTLPKPKDKTKHFNVLHCDHNSMLFSIAAPIQLLNEYNWWDERKLNVWTVGQDRLLLNTSLSSRRKNLACYPTLGNAECFALSPLDPNRLAIGTAEGIIKVWDLSRPNIKNITMTSFFQKIQSKVISLAWHPADELILAYGTVEGRVGFLDTSNKSKMPIIPPHFFKSQVHKIEWGPVNGNTEDFGLFVTAEGKLVIFGMKKSEKVPTEVDTPDDTFVYTFAWKLDYTRLLVGTKSGMLILYSPELKILSTHYFQHRLKDIYWHPETVQSDPTASKRCYWFAAISNSKDVIVYNFQEDIGDGEKIVAKCEHSDDLINFVSWSPYSANELVIASDEGIARIWDVEENNIISTYTSPNFESIIAAIWSPVDSDCIISALKDHTVRVWKITDHPSREEKELKELRKKIIKEIAKEQNDLLPKAEKTTEETPKVKIAKTNLLPNFFYSKESPQIVNELRKLFLSKEGSSDVEAGDGDSTCDILKVFGSKSDMLSIIEQNEIVHREKGKFSLGYTLSLFKGDIGAKINKAVEEKRVTPWIIMMAPIVSPKLWQSACEVYAQQLSEMADSEPLEIATFYLACHKVEEAIDVLCGGAMYREALALAKCRLPEGNPTVTNIMEKWARYSVGVGNFEAAAQCYICLNKYEDAASVLFRRSDVETLKFAAELAEKSGNEELHKAVLFRYNSYKNENGAEEKELPSRVDLALKQHLELDDKKEVNLQESADFDNDRKSNEAIPELQIGEKVSTEKNKLEVATALDEVETELDVKKQDISEEPTDLDKDRKSDEISELQSGQKGSFEKNEVEVVIKTLEEETGEEKQLGIDKPIEETIVESH